MTFQGVGALVHPELRRAPTLTGPHGWAFAAFASAVFWRKPLRNLLSSFDIRLNRTTRCYSMPLPEQIPVRYTEDDAGYLTMRPVVKQTFRLSELADMVVSVAGKDASRVQQIFRNGTVIYNGYRYWWEGISAASSDIEALLAPFPEDDPARPFDSDKVTAALLEIGGGTQLHVSEITRQAASEKKLFGKYSPWELFLRDAVATAPRYVKYSHARKADLFRISLPHEKSRQLLAALLEAAPRGLRHRWSTLQPPAAITFVCPR
jgi:hypothetical protein